MIISHPNINRPKSTPNEYYETFDPAMLGGMGHHVDLDYDRRVAKKPIGFSADFSKHPNYAGKKKAR